MHPTTTTTTMTMTKGTTSFFPLLSRSFDIKVNVRVPFRPSFPLPCRIHFVLENRVRQDTRGVGRPRKWMGIELSLDKQVRRTALTSLTGMELVGIFPIVVYHARRDETRRGTTIRAALERYRRLIFSNVMRSPCSYEEVQRSIMTPC